MNNTGIFNYSQEFLSRTWEGQFPIQGDRDAIIFSTAHETISLSLRGAFLASGAPMPAPFRVHTLVRYVPASLQELRKQIHKAAPKLAAPLGTTADLKLSVLHYRLLQPAVLATGDPVLASMAGKSYVLTGSGALRFTFSVEQDEFGWLLRDQETQQVSFLPALNLTEMRRYIMPTLTFKEVV